LDEKRVFLFIYNQHEYIGDNLLYQQLVETEKISPSTRAFTTSILHKESSQVLGVIGFLLHRIGKSWGLNIKRVQT
jgi:hypothetical protein